MLGVPGDALHTNNTSVYLSRNGGYNWTKVIAREHEYCFRVFAIELVQFSLCIVS